MPSLSRFSLDSMLEKLSLSGRGTKDTVTLPDSSTIHTDIISTEHAMTERILADETTTSTIAPLCATTDDDDDGSYPDRTIDPQTIQESETSSLASLRSQESIIEPPPRSAYEPLTCPLPRNLSRQTSRTSTAGQRSVVLDHAGNEIKVTRVRDPDAVCGHEGLVLEARMRGGSGRGGGGWTRQHPQQQNFTRNGQYPPQRQYQDQRPYYPQPQYQQQQQYQQQYQPNPQYQQQYPPYPQYPQPVHQVQPNPRGSSRRSGTQSVHTSSSGTRVSKSSKKRKSKRDQNYMDFMTGRKPGQDDGLHGSYSDLFSCFRSPLFLCCLNVHDVEVVGRDGTRRVYLKKNKGNGQEDLDDD